MLTQLLALIGAHNYLALAIVATLYVRTLCGPDSKFPITLPVKWQPSVTAACTLAYVFESAWQGGDTVAQAGLAALVSAASTGFLDGLCVAIWNGANAPSWARAIVFLVDDIAGGGGAAKPPSAPKGPSVLAGAAMLLVVGILAIVPASTGCGLFAGSKLPSDIDADVQCVMSQVEGGQTSLTQIATACGGLGLQTVVDIVELLLGSSNGKVPPANRPALEEELGKAKALLAAQKATKADLDSIEQNRAVAARLLNYAGAGAPLP